jgi:iron complex outermembrane receptor protein
LRPEHSTNYELGYRDLFFKKVVLKTAVFYMDIDDYILQMSVPNPSNSRTTLLQNQNVGHVEQYGFEIDVSAPIVKTLDGGFNYTYIDTNNRSTSDKLTSVPEHKFFVYAKYMPFKGLSFLADMETDSRRYSTTTGSGIAKGYTIVNGKTMFQIVKGLMVEGGVRNILDKNYEITEGFPMAGRTYFANIVYSF